MAVEVVDASFGIAPNVSRLCDVRDKNILNFRLITKHNKNE
jgi:hypothetical protein